MSATQTLELRQVKQAATARSGGSGIFRLCQPPLLMCSCMAVRAASGSNVGHVTSLHIRDMLASSQPNFTVRLSNTALDMSNEPHLVDGWPVASACTRRPEDANRTGIFAQCTRDTRRARPTRVMDGAARRCYRRRARRSDRPPPALIGCHSVERLITHSSDELIL